MTTEKEVFTRGTKVRIIKNRGTTFTLPVDGVIVSRRQKYDIFQVDIPPTGTWLFKDTDMEAKSNE